MLISLILSALAIASPKIYAEYEVPVPEELASYARFAMEPVEVKNEEGEIHFEYYLPTLLTGIPSEVKMRGLGSRDESGLFRLRGDLGNADCDGFEKGRQCRVKYLGLPVDLALAEAELDKLNLSEADRAGVLQVIKRFQGVEEPATSPVFLIGGGDMQGIIHFGANR